MPLTQRTHTSKCLRFFSARDNVDVHFAYICRAHAAFESRFGAALSTASAAVDGFDAAWARCAAAELHPHVQARLARMMPPPPSLSTAAAASSSPPCAAAAPHLPPDSPPQPLPASTLAELYPRERLRRMAGDGARGRDALAAKGAELGGALAALQRATEALFMAGPTCDVGALQARLAGGAAHAERAGAAAAALESDAAVRACACATRPQKKRKKRKGVACSVAPFSVLAFGVFLSAFFLSFALTRVRAAAQTVRRLVADASLLASDAAGVSAGAASSSSSSLSRAPLSAADACAALEPMHARHLATHLPVRTGKSPGAYTRVCLFACPPCLFACPPRSLTRHTLPLRTGARGCGRVPLRAAAARGRMQGRHDARRGGAAG
jgi:hypothetical protein